MVKNRNIEGLTPIVLVTAVSASLFFCGLGKSGNNSTDRFANSFGDELHASPIPTPQKEEMIRLKWHQTWDFATFSWDGSDLSAEIRGAKVPSIFRSISRTRVRDLRRDPNTRNCEVTHLFKLSSIFASIITFEQVEVLFCGTTSSEWRYVSIDLSKSVGLNANSFSELESNSTSPRGNPLVSLSDLFPEEDILSSLLANDRLSSGISSALKAKKIDHEPKTLREFQGMFSTSDPDSFGDLFLERDFLTRFAIHHVDLNSERVFCWISLTPYTHASQAVRDHIEISLPIPKKLRETLLLAQNEAAGFLFADSNSKVGTNFARFEYGNKESD